MAFRIEGYIDFDLKINGIDIPIGESSLRGITVMQDVKSRVPTLQANITDTAKLSSRHDIFRDGAMVDIGFGPGSRQTATSQFRLMNTPKAEANGQSKDISFTGILNQPKFFRDTMNDAVSGKTSSDALKQIAGKLGIKVDADSTNDKMTWLPLNKPFSQTMQHIAEHGFSNATSAMMLVFGGRGDGSWGLIYKDLTRQLGRTHVAKLVSEKFSKPGDIAVSHHSGRSHSGTLNNTGGYSGNLSFIDPKGAMSLIDKIPIVKGGVGNLNMSSAVKGLVEMLPRQFLPADTSNSHKRYQQAKIQNERAKMTFSNFLTVYTRDYTNLQLLDPVEVEVYEGDEPDKSLCGKYLVHARAQHVAGKHYREKITLARQGSNGSSGSGEGMV